MWRPAKPPRRSPNVATSRPSPRWESLRKRCLLWCWRTRSLRSSAAIRSAKRNGIMAPIFRTSRPGSAADPSKPHLILVGLPGSGKTTIGEAAAEQLGRTFLDLDQEIERREGRSISQIFGEKGEPYFRRRERELTEELALFGNMIISP